MTGAGGPKHLGGSATTNLVAKLDVGTSCVDLLVESTSKCVDCKGKKVVVAESYEDTIKLKDEIVMLKKELQEQAKHKTVVIESLDQGKKLVNKLLKEENQYLKLGLMYDKQEEDETFILDELASNNDPIIKKLTQENNKLKKEKEHLTKLVSLLFVAICVASNCPSFSFVTCKSLSSPSVCSFTFLSKCCMMPLVRGVSGVSLPSSAPGMVQRQRQQKGK